DTVTLSPHGALPIYAAAHAVDRIAEVLDVARPVVDGEDAIAGEHAGFVRGRVLDRVDDLDDAVFERDLDADAGVFARGADADLVELLRVEIRRVRIQVRHQTADRRFDELLIGDALDVLATHVLQHFGEQPRVLPRHRRIGARIRVTLRGRLGRRAAALRLHSAADGQPE